MANKTIAKLIESEIHNYARENLAIINIFIKESYIKRFRKTEKMSRISYIASSGGLLGLCMGFSFVSLAEIAYHCFLCIVLLFRKKRALFKKAQIQKNEQKRRRQRSSPISLSPTFSPIPTAPPQVRDLPTPPPPPYQSASICVSKYFVQYVQVTEYIILHFPTLNFIPNTYLLV